jgi:hypothetical protein
MNVKTKGIQNGQFVSERKQKGEWNLVTREASRGKTTEKDNAETVRAPRIRREERAESGIWLTITMNVTI